MTNWKGPRTIVWLCIFLRGFRVGGLLVEKAVTQTVYKPLFWNKLGLRPKSCLFPMLGRIFNFLHVQLLGS